MIGVIIVPGPSSKMLGLDQQVPSCLLPLGDRPILQHLLELLLLAGVRSFELIQEQAPGPVEAYFGSGAKWGCQLRYRVAADPRHPYQLLRGIGGLQDEPWLLVHANRFPYISIANYAGSRQPTLFCTDNDLKNWSGSVLLPAATPAEEIARLSPLELGSYLFQLESLGQAVAVYSPGFISAETPANLLAAQRRFLDREYPDFMLGGIERVPSVWVSRDLVVHPSARIVPPAYVGPNCRIEQGVRIGPHGVVSGNCVIDAHTTIRDSLVTAGTYVGQRLELDGVIVDRNLLVSTRLSAGVAITDDFLLGPLPGTPARGRL